CPPARSGAARGASRAAAATEHAATLARTGPPARRCGRASFRGQPPPCGTGLPDSSLPPCAVAAYCRLVSRVPAKYYRIAAHCPISRDKQKPGARARFCVRMEANLVEASVLVACDGVAQLGI